MSWDPINDKQALVDFTYTIDSDNIKVKERVKQVLLNNRFIIHALNNQELDEDEPDSYFGVCILPYYMVPDIQTSVKSYICYEVGSENWWGNGRRYGYNESSKSLQITFHVLCNYGDTNLIDTETGIARHDLIAALLQDAFNYTTYIGGGKMKLISDVPGTTDKKFATRTLVFEEITDNNFVKTRNGNARLANKDVQQIATAKV